MMVRKTKRTRFNGSLGSRFLVFPVLLAFVVLSILLFTKNQISEEKKNQAVTPTPTTRIPNSETRDLGNGWIEYTSHDFGFEIMYPGYFKLQELPEQDIEQVAIIYEKPPNNPQKQGDIFDEGILVKVSYLLISGRLGSNPIPFEELINKGEQTQKIILTNETAYVKNSISLVGGKDYYIKKDDSNYFVLWVVVRELDDREYQKIADQIVGSFKVIR
jgi:hypothetical protein